jgi:uncharacterized membrane protein YhaH (DUF805 family)
LKIISIQNFLSFEGRIGRQHYLLSFGLLFIAAFLFRIVVVGLIFGVPILLPHDITDKTELLETLKNKVLGDSITTVCMIWPSSALCVRRLHDRGWPGLINLAWFVFVAVDFSMIYFGTSVIPVLNTQGIWELENTYLSHLVGGFGILMQLFFVVELWCRRGIVGPNKYGPDPLEY